jgi:hypothetical protein
MMDILKEIESLKEEHFWMDEDGWWNCPLSRAGCPDDRVPKDKCRCGAEKQNAKVDAIIAELKSMGFH